MPRKSIYLERILQAAEHKCTADQLAAALDVSVAHARALLRYWEDAGMVTPQLSARRQISRSTARFRLTVQGMTTLREIRVGAGYAGIGDLAALLRAPLSPRV